MMREKFKEILEKHTSNMSEDHYYDGIIDAMAEVHDNARLKCIQKMRENNNILKRIIEKIKS